MTWQFHNGVARTVVGGGTVSRTFVLARRSHSVNGKVNLVGTLRETLIRNCRRLKLKLQVVRTLDFHVEGELLEGDGRSSLCTDSFALSTKVGTGVRKGCREGGRTLLRLKESAQAAQQACRDASVDCEEDGEL